MGASLGGLLSTCGGINLVVPEGTSKLRGGLDIAAEEAAATATDDSEDEKNGKKKKKKKTHKKKKKEKGPLPRYKTPVDSDPSHHVQRTEPLVLTVPTPQKDDDKFVLTFVGDTMIANLAYNWEFMEWGPERPMDAGFAGVRHLLDKSDFIVMNLEGPISTLPIKADPKHRGHSFSFGMDPRAADVIKSVLGDRGVLNMANNHVSDRGIHGWYDTMQHLDRVGLPYFGTGTTDDERALPLLLDTPTQGRIGISTYMGTPTYCCDSLKFDGENKTHLTQRPEEPEAVALSMKLLEENNVDIKIGFAHWIQNYKVGVSEETRDAAALLASSGYDVLIGSAGSHTVKEFDWVNDEIPCFFDIGNFVFMKPGYWYRKDKEAGNQFPLTYGTVTHLIFVGGKPVEFEIHCTQNNQDVVHYNPRVCTPEEAKELFTHLGPFIDYIDGNSYATVDLRKPNRVPPRVAQLLMNQGATAAAAVVEASSSSSSDGEVEQQKVTPVWEEAIAEAQKASRIDNSHLVKEYKKKKKAEKDHVKKNKKTKAKDHKSKQAEADTPQEPQTYVMGFARRADDEAVPPKG